MSLLGVQNLAQIFKYCRVFLLEGLNFQKSEGKNWATLGAIRWLTVQNF